MAGERRKDAAAMVPSAARGWRICRHFFGGGLVLAALAAAHPAYAQHSGDGFLIGRSPATLTLRGGFDKAHAGGDLFDFTSNQLTLSPSDFSGPEISADLAFHLTPRLDFSVGAGVSTANARSEYRHFVDQDNLPIEQTTQFRRVPVTASVRAYLTSPGRSVGTLAWIPARFAPYIGVGGGMMWYRFEQSGDFIDTDSNVVFPDKFTSTGWTPTAHAMLGLDYSLNPRLVLTGEGRYTWAHATPGDDFSGFDRLDLSGMSATLGIGIRL